MEKNENVQDIVKKVGNALGVAVREEHMDACHRLSVVQQGRKRGIIVKFTRRSVKEELLRKRKVESGKKL